MATSSSLSSSEHGHASLPLMTTSPSLSSPEQWDVPSNSYMALWRGVTSPTGTKGASFRNKAGRGVRLAVQRYADILCLVEATTLLYWYVILPYSGFALTLHLTLNAVAIVIPIRPTTILSKLSTPPTPSSPHSTSKTTRAGMRSTHMARTAFLTIGPGPQLAKITNGKRGTSLSNTRSADIPSISPLQKRNS